MLIWHKTQAMGFMSIPYILSLTLFIICFTCLGNNSEVSFELASFINFFAKILTARIIKLPEPQLKSINFLSCISCWSVYPTLFNM